MLLNTFSTQKKCLVMNWFTNVVITGLLSFSYCFPDILLHIIDFSNKILITVDCVCV